MSGGAGRRDCIHTASPQGGAGATGVCCAWDGLSGALIPESGGRPLGFSASDVAAASQGSCGAIVVGRVYSYDIAPTSFPGQARATNVQESTDVPVKRNRTRSMDCEPRGAWQSGALPLSVMGLAHHQAPAQAAAAASSSSSSSSSAAAAPAAALPVRARPSVTEMDLGPIDWSDINYAAAAAAVAAPGGAGAAGGGATGGGGGGRGGGGAMIDGGGGGAAAAAAAAAAGRAAAAASMCGGAPPPPPITVKVATDPAKRRRPRGPSRKGSLLDGLPEQSAVLAAHRQQQQMGAAAGMLAQLDEEEAAAGMDMT